MQCKNEKRQFLKTLLEGKALNWEGKSTTLTEALKPTPHPLKARLKGLGITQASVADLCECSLASMNQWLTGTYTMPEGVEDIVTKLSDAYERERQEVQNEKD